MISEVSENKSGKYVSCQCHSIIDFLPSSRCHLRCGLKPQVYMAAILPLLIAYCAIKSMKILSYFSALANVLCVGSLAIILISLFQVPD